jgi:CheY-like chemotaxis protein
VVLPAAPSERVVVASPPPPPAPPAGRRARILVVDDDAGIGDLVRESLTPEHEVVALTRASDAFELLTAGEQFDVILCDLMMPVMTGMDLYEGLAHRVPTHADRMVFLTGGVFTPRAEQFLAGMSRPRLDKPFDLEGLRNFVRERLASASAGLVAGSPAASPPSSAR